MQNGVETWWVFWGAVAASFILNSLWQWWLLLVRGGGVLKQAQSATSWYFKTREGEYRVDQTHRKFSCKLSKTNQWVTHSFDDIRQIYVFTSTDEAIWTEFFFGGWNILDLAQRYRDVMHSRSICLWLQDSSEIPLMTFKQYEQRDWFLGRLFVVVTIKILRALGMYQEVDDVAHEALHALQHKFESKGLSLVVR